MRWLNLTLVGGMLIVGITTAIAQQVQRMGNPVLPVQAADPHIALFGNKYYIYATGAGKTEAGFTAWSSPDLVSWINEGMILRFADVGWAKKDDWAPGIIERNGKYYFYFSADSRIGVAVGDSPVGPFKDPLGKPLVPYKDDISVIDPMAFIDDDGQAYLYYGAVPASWLKGKVERIGTTLSVQKLNPDMISFAGPELPTVEVGPDNAHIEGSFLVKRKGIYYLMWSQGNWDAGDETNGYRVLYATSNSPTGPWKKVPQPILSSRHDIQVIGPGHHSVLHIPGTDDYYIAYHRHRNDKDRKVCIDKMEFNPDGTIKPVVPTLEGINAVPATLSLKAGHGPLRAGMDMALEANTTWPGEQVRKMEFFANGNKLGEVAVAPYRLTWRKVPAGFYQVSAKATGATGATITCAPLNIDVN